MKIKRKFQKHNQSIYGEKNILESVAMMYQENSKLSPVSSRIQGERIGGFLNPYFIERSTNPYKIYSSKIAHSLDDFKTLSLNQDIFKQTINNRTSGRDYEENYKISLFELFEILHYSYGINRTDTIDDSNAIMKYRYVPSAGGLYPLEIYIVLFNAHIESGLYHYDILNNKLELIKSGDFKDKMKSITNAEPYVNVNNSCGVIMISSLVERQMIKYGERSYRFILQEVGQVSQMLSLLFEYNNFGSCIVGGYLDEQVNKFIGIDGVFENIQNIIFFGKKKEL